jgi:hypothetical protein
VVPTSTVGIVKQRNFYALQEAKPRLHCCLVRSLFSTLTQLQSPPPSNNKASNNRVKLSTELNSNARVQGLWLATLKLLRFQDQQNSSGSQVECVSTTVSCSAGGTVECRDDTCRLQRFLQPRSPGRADVAAGSSATSV